MKERESSLSEMKR